MKSALKVTSWIAVVLGAFAILGGVGQLTTAPSEAGYSLAGGALFFAQGIMSLIYIDQTKTGE